jgi:hypothetical protein
MRRLLNGKRVQRECSRCSERPGRSFPFYLVPFQPTFANVLPCTSLINRLAVWGTPPTTLPRSSVRSGRSHHTMGLFFAGREEQS